MADIPAEAVQAALDALEWEDGNRTYFTFKAMAEVALKAAAPFIAEHIAQLLDTARLLALADINRPSATERERLACRARTFETAAEIAREAYPKGDDR